MYQITDSLLCRENTDNPLTDLPIKTLVNQLCKFVEEKVVKIINNLPPPLLGDFIPA